MVTRVTADPDGNASAEQLGGGGLRVAHDLPSADHSTSNIQPDGRGARVETRDAGSRVVQRVGANGDVVTEEVPNHHSTSAAEHRAARGPGILASARDAFGLPVEGVRLNKDTIVTINGMETSLAAAETMGFVSRGPDGTYREGPADAAAHAAEENNTDDTASAVAFEADAEATFQEVANSFAPELQSALVEHLVTGTLDGALNDLAAAGGMSPEELSAKASAVHNAFIEQAADVVRGEGMDPEAFHGWMREHHPDWLAALSREHVYTRNPNVWRQAVAEYMRSEAPSAEAVRASGYEVRTINGVDCVVVNGQEIPLAVVARLGMM